MDLVTAAVILLAVAMVCATALVVAALITGYLRDRHGVVRRPTTAPR